MRLNTLKKLPKSLSGLRIELDCMAAINTSAVIWKRLMKIIKNAMIRVHLFTQNIMWIISKGLSKSTGVMAILQPLPKTFGTQVNYAIKIQSIHFKGPLS